MSEISSAELPIGCPMGGLETHEVAFRAVITNRDIRDLGKGDQNLKSLCSFYRRIGLCTVPVPSPEIEAIEE
jgi:hypothetical protein